MLIAAVAASNLVAADTPSTACLGGRRQALIDGGFTGPLVMAAGKAGPTPVCQVIRDARELIGKRVQVDGYVQNLGSHGFVLTGRRSDCDGILVLRIEALVSNRSWWKAFENSLGPKRATLVGTVGWQKARYDNGRNPALEVDRVLYLSPQEANPTDF